jgi:hypothetical protein
MTNFISFKFIYFTIILTILSLLIFNCSQFQPEDLEKMGVEEKYQQEVIQAMQEKFGEKHSKSIEQGVRQVAERWKMSDGTPEAFHDFCLANFFTNEEERDVIFARFQNNLEVLYGNLHKIDRQFKWALDVNEGEVHPIDHLFGYYDNFAHVNDDFFKTKLAFVALLNYPLKSLEEKNTAGLEWLRKNWAEIRLVENFRSRVPAEVYQNRTTAHTKADNYIANYNILMYHLLDAEGNRLFPKELKLISHWGLRDELKAQYANTEGLLQQKIIQKVMERIILQEIPLLVINSEAYDWNPYSNKIFKAGSKEEISFQTEPNTRYQRILDNFHAELELDPYYPNAPSLIDRRFNLNREMSESDVEKLFTDILSAPVLKEIATLISKRLARPLETFDIWYDGFKARSNFSEKALDQKAGQLYPSVDAFQKDLPYILRKIGFSPKKAEFLAEHIQVDPSRGAGHAMGAMMREDKAHLRTRIPPGGMNYKGFNIAIHELGHNVEQVFSLNEMDYYTLNGVPNTAFTEAFAFVFQSRDLEILGIAGTSNKAEDLRVLNDMWATFEISGVALVDMYLWRWMYKNPNTNTEQLKAAMVDIARQVWNKYFAPVLGIENQFLLAIYSHIIYRAMYTPDYPLGHIISFQIEQYLKEHDLALEMERMCKLGTLAPQIWMQKAVEEKISAQPLIMAAEKAVKNIKPE